MRQRRAARQQDGDAARLESSSPRRLRLRARPGRLTAVRQLGEFHEFADVSEPAVRVRMRARRLAALTTVLQLGEFHEFADVGEPAVRVRMRARR